MKIIITCFLLQLFSYGKCESDESDYPGSGKITSEEIYNTTGNSEPKNCTSMKFGCESCTDLVMCIDTEYGFMKQYVKCPAGSSCLRDRCTTAQNPLCDGTADIPFKCHVPGMYPDPFDCTKYHFCVPETNRIINHTMQLKHYQHSCQEDVNGVVQYKYDPKSTYCKFKLEKGCTEWPIPLCPNEGFADFLAENESLFYVCELVQGHLYPHLYVCPHGEQYNSYTTKCEQPLRRFDSDDHWNRPTPFVY